MYVCESDSDASLIKSFTCMNPFLPNQVMESDEAFFNSNNLLQQAFADQNPAPLLLDILNAHPTYPTLRDLVFYYAEAVSNDPYRAKTLASALVTIGQSPDSPDRVHTLAELLYLELGRTHFYYNDDNDTVYGPKNTYLLESLLSGFSLRYDLTSTTTMYAYIEKGLKAPRGLEESEVLVVGTCIQLLLHASGTDKKPGKVAKKLKAHKAAKTVKDPHAIEVLEVRYSIFCHCQRN
jgi:hypothetical protein